MWWWTTCSLPLNVKEWPKNMEPAPIRFFQSISDEKRVRFRSSQTSDCRKISLGWGRNSFIGRFQGLTENVTWKLRMWRGNFATQSRKRKIEIWLSDLFFSVQRCWRSCWLYLNKLFIEKLVRMRDQHSWSPVLPWSKYYYAQTVLCILRMLNVIPISRYTDEFRRNGGNRGWWSFSFIGWWSFSLRLYLEISAKLSKRTLWNLGTVNSVMVTLAIT